MVGACLIEGISTYLKMNIFHRLQCSSPRKIKTAKIDLVHTTTQKSAKKGDKLTLKAMMKLILSFIILSGVAYAQSPPRFNKTTREDFDAISRCSFAAFLVVGASEIETENKQARDQLIRKGLKAQEAVNQPKDLPSPIDMVMAQAALENLLSKGIRPGDSPRMHDWFIAQVAATCAITTERQN